MLCDVGRFLQNQIISYGRTIIQGWRMRGVDQKKFIYGCLITQKPQMQHGDTDAKGRLSGRMLAGGHPPSSTPL